MARRFQTFSLRFALEATFVFSAGLAGYQAVYAGEANRWPGFQVREGYWGTQFLSSVLYAIGDDRVVLRIVSGTWFGYAALIAVGLVVVGRLCVRPGRTTSPG
jgi:hypothetical protein